MPKHINTKVVTQVRELIDNGLSNNDIMDETGVSRDFVRMMRADEYYPQPPPIEQAIRMLECNKTHKQVEYQWGSEVLAEALTFYTIPTVEEYKEKYKL